MRTSDEIIVAMAIVTTNDELIIRLADREVHVRWERCSPILAAATADQRLVGPTLSRRLRHPLAALGRGYFH